MGKTCCFSGHRPTKLPWGYDESKVECLDIKEKIKEILINAITNEDYTNFISGVAQGIDTICAEIVIELKKDFNITLECAFPFKEHSKSWAERDKLRLQKIVENADKITYVCETGGKRNVYFIRNCYMINNSQMLTAVTNGEKGGTSFTIDYAKKKNLDIKIIDLEKVK